MQFDFFYPEESENYVFYRTPKVLCTDKRFRGLSSDAKLLYGILLDRIQLSKKNRWIDEEGHVSHEIQAGKYTIKGMPSAFAKEENAATLRVVLRDCVSGIYVELLYGAFEDSDVITRAVKIVNDTDSAVTLYKTASACLDLPEGEWDMIHFHGRHTLERQLERSRVITGIQRVSPKRGTSSHQQNPFVILTDRNTGEDAGECYGMMLVYSGNHCADVEKDQVGSVRCVMGIHDEQFSWKLEPGDSFETPEVLMAYSNSGLGELSRQYHNFIRAHICESTYMRKRRPVLINNWEATYFDFDSEKIVKIAEQAAALGVEMFVLDDGWFGARVDDNAGLGDWYVNEKKLPGGLSPLIERINALGLKFGIWVEPEMVNEDSDLYRAHPDWIFSIPGRDPCMSRNQMVLDLPRKDVTDWLYEALYGLLSSNPIEYVKWDMNRHLTDVCNMDLPADRQGELFHRYVLGLYDILTRLTEAFPEVLFESCSGGGGRFDAAMLYFSPQIWCSDNTDAVERLYLSVR